MSKPIISPELDPQDPLPESRWFWRRLIVWFCTIVTYAFLGWTVWRAHQNDMPGIAANLMLLLGVLLTFYLIAPSANQLAELLATLKLRIRGPRSDGAQPPDCDDDDRPRQPQRRPQPAPRGGGGMLDRAADELRRRMGR